jgi:hypothetical protein
MCVWLLFGAFWNCLSAFCVVWVCPSLQIFLLDCLRCVFLAERHTDYQSVVAAIGAVVRDHVVLSEACHLTVRPFYRQRFFVEHVPTIVKV